MAGITVGRRGMYSPAIRTSFTTPGFVSSGLNTPLFSDTLGIPLASVSPLLEVGVGVVVTVEGEVSRDESCASFIDLAGEPGRSWLQRFNLALEGLAVSLC